MPDIDIILIIKYALSAIIVWSIWMFPVYLARQNGSSDLDMIRIRIASWLFGWTGIGWFYGLWIATKK